VSRKSRVVILNQYYVPDVASTGHLLHELAVELARLGFEVEVLTGRPAYGPPESWQDCPLRETTPEGVRIRRLKVWRFDKNFLPGRALNYLSFVVPMVLRVLMTNRRDTVYLYTTNPPFLAAIGAFASLFRKHNYVTLLHDAYPQVAVWVGTINSGSLVERVWSALNRFKYGRSREAIVLCAAAKQLVAGLYPIDADRVHVIPNWADSEDLRPKPKSESTFAAEHGLLDDFVLLYSGNMGLYYEFETVLDAAAELRGERFKLVLVGGGGKKKWIEQQVRERGLDNVVILPYQPYEKLPDSLNACDASLVSIARGIEGISFPSKLYTSLAVGKAIVALSEESSELRSVVERNGCGIWAALGDGAAMAEKIRGLMRDPALTDRMGERARRVFERGYTRRACVAKYAKVLRLADPMTTDEERAELRRVLSEELREGAVVLLDDAEPDPAVPVAG
jgi:glycosyltransferase involved in cell wall biosynthesis